MSTVANTNSCSTAYWNTQSLRRHLRLSHRITSTQVEVEDDPLLEGLENASEDPDDAMDSFNWDDGTEMEDPTIVGSPAYFFQSNTMQDHLNNVRETSFFGAVTRLVCRSAHGGKERTKDEVPSQWIKLYLHVAHLVLMLGDDGRELLSEILIFFKRLCTSTLGRLLPLPDMPIPTTTQDFQSMVLNGSNKNSLHSILPIPQVDYLAPSEHAYSSLCELVATAMFLPPLSSIRLGVPARYKSMMHSELFFEQRNRVPRNFLEKADSTPCILAFVPVWSDGWDPNRSNKGNRYPVWTATATIILVQLSSGSDDKPYLAVTQLWAAGPGKGSHSAFFQAVVLEKQNKWEDTGHLLRPIRMYSREHGADVNVFISLGAFLQDNPERRGFWGLLAGNSNTHGMFGVCCDFNKLSTQFNACQRCAQSCVQYLEQRDYDTCGIPRECADCLGFSVDRLCRQGRYESPIGGENLRLSEGDPGYDLTLGPGRLDGDGLKEAWQFAIEKHIHAANGWGVGNVKAYLKLFCMNDCLLDRFVDEARSYINIREAANPERRVVFEPEDLLRYQRKLEKGEHRLPQYPPAWDLVQIQDTTETPMHLVMNLLKSLMCSVLWYCKCRDRQPDFIRRANEMIGILKKMHVELMPLLQFKDHKFGGYVAENYQSIGMVLPWLSHIVDEDDMQPPDKSHLSSEDLGDFMEWNGKVCKAWLTARGFTGLGKWSAEKAQKHVRDYKNGPVENIPALVSESSRALKKEIIRRLMYTANSFCATIMLTDLHGDKAKNRAQALVSLFLFYYEMVDKAIHPARKAAIWIAKYNMLGLFRVPQHFVRHHHVRSLYEGGEIGEGIVKVLRMLCPRGVRDGWSKNLINAFYRKRSMEGLKMEVASVWSPEWTLFERVREVVAVASDYRKKKFRRYSHIQEVVMSLTKGYPVSVVVLIRLTDKKVFPCCVVADRGAWSLHLLDLAEEESSLDQDGFLYFPVDIIVEPVAVNTISSLCVDGYTFHCYGMMIPELWCRDATHPNYRYAVISEDWEQLEEGNTWTTAF
jgi:hypothetical protein